MKIQKLTFIFYIIIILGMGWKVYSYLNPNYKECFVENKEKFDLNRQKLNKIITHIEQKYLANWDRQNAIDLPVDSLDEPTRETLKELGISSIEIEGNPNDKCIKNYWITLNVIEDWNIGTLCVVQLIFAPCSETTILNYHYYDGYHRDSWGQGGNWLIYSDTDFI